MRRSAFGRRTRDAGRVAMDGSGGARDRGPLRPLSPHSTGTPLESRGPAGGKGRGPPAGTGYSPDAEARKRGGVPAPPSPVRYRYRPPEGSLFRQPPRTPVGDKLRR